MTAPTEPANDPHDTLADIEFLSRSPHRVEAMRALANAPRTRYELRDRTNVSRVTIRRMLEDFEERGWIEHEGGQYEVTAMGRVVAREFARLRTNLETAADLAEALPWLPTEAFDFDLVHLRDADVLLASSWPDHAASVSHACDLVRGVDRIRGSAIGWTPEVVEVIRDQVVAGETSFDVVVGPLALGMMRAEDNLRDKFHDILAADASSIYRYTGEAPLHMVMTIDETVSICGHVDDGPPPGTLETEDEVVHDWAERYYDSVRADTHQLTREALTPEDQGAT